MIPSWRSWCWKLGLASSLAVGGAIASSGDGAFAQITPDGTLGAERSVVTRSGSSYAIEGGATRGGNLFHSFEQFSVPTKGEAFFNNSPAIQNIISRVTGASISNIDGLIRANGKANLFLINPNGIIFGPNASLNIGGSFLASTASSLKFADGTQFSATAPQTKPLLTINVPLGLQFGPTPGAIRVQGPGAVRDPDTGLLLNREAGLKVLPEETLALVGSDVALEGGILTTYGGRIELGSVAGQSLVSLTPTNKGFSLGYGGAPTFGDIHLSQQAAVDTSGPGGGDIQVRGRQVTLTDGSDIEASTLGSEPGGTLAVTASESVEVTGTSANGNTSALTAQVYSKATGAGGNVTLETGRLILRDGGQIGTETDGQGDAGNLDVTATESVKVIGEAKVESFRSGLFSQSGGVFFMDPTPTGNGGNLRINTRQLIVRDGLVSVATFTQGNGGNLEVNARDLVVEGAASTIRATASGTAIGSGGNIRINTERLLLRDGADVTVSSTGFNTVQLSLRVR